jgi:small subunit ribosomal protein S2
MFYVTERWLGGLLTNIKTVRKSIGRLKEIERLAEEGILAQLPKKEVASLMREKTKLDRDLTGIKDMNDLPGAIFIIDTRREKIAVAEGRRLGIPIIALVDTNSDPEEIEYPIVSNDDAIRAIKLMADVVSRACAEGIKLRPAAAEEGKKSRRGRKMREEAGQKEAAVAVEETVTPPAEPEVVKAEGPMSKEDTPASKEDAPASKEDAPTSKEDAPASKEDAPASKEDAPALKEDAPASKEDVPVEEPVASPEGASDAVAEEPLAEK